VKSESEIRKRLFFAFQCMDTQNKKIPNPNNPPVERLLKLAPLHRPQHHIQRIVLAHPDGVPWPVSALPHTADALAIERRPQELGHLMNYRVSKHSSRKAKEI